MVHRSDPVRCSERKPCWGPSAAASPHHDYSIHEPVGQLLVDEEGVWLLLSTGWIILSTAYSTAPLSWMLSGGCGIRCKDMHTWHSFLQICTHASSADLFIFNPPALPFPAKLFVTSQVSIYVLTSNLCHSIQKPLGNGLRQGPAYLLTSACPISQGEGQDSASGSLV